MIKNMTHAYGIVYIRSQSIYMYIVSSYLPSRMIPRTRKAFDSGVPSLPGSTQ